MKRLLALLLLLVSFFSICCVETGAGQQGGGKTFRQVLAEAKAKMQNTKQYSITSSLNHTFLGPGGGTLLSAIRESAYSEKRLLEENPLEEDYATRLYYTGNETFFCFETMGELECEKSNETFFSYVDFTFELLEQSLEKPEVELSGAGEEIVLDRICDRISAQYTEELSVEETNETLTSVINVTACFDQETGAPLYHALAIADMDSQKEVVALSFSSMMPIRFETSVESALFLLPWENQSTGPEKPEKPQEESSNVLLENISSGSPETSGFLFKKITSEQAASSKETLRVEKNQIVELVFDMQTWNKPVSLKGTRQHLLFPAYDENQTICFYDQYTPKHPGVSTTATATLTSAEKTGLYLVYHATASASSCEQLQNDPALMQQVKNTSQALFKISVQ